MSKNELNLLRSYASGPKIWDAWEVLPKVWELADRGLIEPAEDVGVYQLTDAGRAKLAESEGHDA